MQKDLKIAAVILLGIAAYFWFNGNNDIAFVTGVAGAVSFFLSVRFGSKTRVDERVAERLAKEEFESELMESNEFDNLAARTETDIYLKDRQ